MAWNSRRVFSRPGSELVKLESCFAKVGMFGENKEIVNNVCRMDEGCFQ